MNQSKSFYPPLANQICAGSINQGSPETSIDRRGVFAEMDRLSNSIGRAQALAAQLREKLGPTLPQTPCADSKTCPQPSSYGHSTLSRGIYEFHLMVDGLCANLGSLCEEVEI